MSEEQDPVQKALNLLGHHVVDKVTGFRGVVTSVCFDLYGCIQAMVHPGMQGEKMGEVCWFDTNRLTHDLDYGKRPVMVAPSFVKEHGPEAKSPQSTLRTH